MALYDQVVAIGADLLDQAIPDWPVRIDTDRLNIGDGRRCILGQLYGDYVTGLKVLGISLDNAYAFGFQLPLARRWDYEIWSSAPRLERAWIKLINDRCVLGAR